MRGRLFFERRVARGRGLDLSDGAGDVLPGAAEEALEGGVEVDLELRERAVDLVLVRGEEGAEVRVVEVGGPCRLW